MKYEIPTCEIVLLEPTDCFIVASSNEYNDDGNDTPFVGYTPNA